MRILVFILALLGAIACGGIAFLLFIGISTAKTVPEINFALQLADQLSKLDDEALLQEISKVQDRELQQNLRGVNLKQLRGALGLFKALEFTTYSLGGAALLGLIGGIFALLRKKWIAIILFLASVGAPVYFALPFRDVKLDEIKAGDVTTKKTEVDFAQFFRYVCGAASPFGLCALLSLLIGSAPTPRRFEDEDERPRGPAHRPVPPIKGGAEDNFFEDDAPPPGKPSEAIQRKEEGFAPTQPRQQAPPPAAQAGQVVARFPCPKCGMSLKKTNPEAGKPIKCPKCATTFPIPVEAVEQANRGASGG
jgi:hypothetical protein